MQTLELVARRTVCKKYLKGVYLREKINLK